MPSQNNGEGDAIPPIPSPRTKDPRKRIGIEPTRALLVDKLAVQIWHRSQTEKWDAIFPIASHYPKRKTLHATHAKPTGFL